MIRRPRPRGAAAAGFADSSPGRAAAMATWAHSPGRSGLVSRHAQPRTSAVLRETTADIDRRPPRPAAALQGSGTVDRDPRPRRRIRGFFADGVDRCQHGQGGFADGDVGSFVWPIRPGIKFIDERPPCPAPHNPVRPRYCAERPRRPTRPAAALQGTGTVDRDPQAARGDGRWRDLPPGSRILRGRGGSVSARTGRVAAMATSAGGGGEGRSRGLPPGSRIPRGWGFLAPAGHPSRICPHLVLGFPRSQLVYCLSEEVRSRTGDLHPIICTPCQTYPNNAPELAIGRFLRSSSI